MPKLVFSSEKAGCGATIELDNGETCLISVAQTGVLVRSYKKGFLSGIVGSFLGPVLYNEKKVYLVAETAASLSSMFPQQNHYLNFKNPVLRAFSIAVWNCATAAEVAVVLNEAITSNSG
jgi:hypothetical protein